MQGQSATLDFGSLKHFGENPNQGKYICLGLGSHGMHDFMLRMRVVNDALIMF